MTLLRGLLGNAGKRSEAGIPEGYRVYAVGDIHGRNDLLGDVLERIEADSAARGQARIVLVFLGDFIDRGPDSAGVVERLRTYSPEGVRLVLLAGNHEEALLRILDGEGHLVADWLRFGGAECMQSYGVDPRRLRRMSPARAAEAIRKAIPAGHAEFLRGCDDTFRAGGYLFAHAGIRPGVPIAEQSQADLRWIREPFLKDTTDHGFVVVHGHTISAEVEERPNRIGIDTGAYRTGVLTAIGLEGNERWYVQATQPAEPEIVGQPA